MDNLGLGDRVVGCASTTLDYLKKYTEQDGVEKLGTIKEADFEAVMACEPDVIFIGGRLSKSYDALSEIAPVVYLATDMEKGVVESTYENAGVIASIFGMEDQVEEKFAGFDERIAALQNIAEGKTAVIGMCTSGSFNVLGNDGRCSIIGTEIGFDNLCKETSSERSGGGERGGQDAGEGKGEENAEGADNAQGGTATHGNEASFELIVSLNPDYIFVMDRDAAIGTEGAQLAKDIMENELVMGTDAYSNGNLVYLENPAVWYTAEGGITALETMLSDLETVLLQE
jgi:iron complex transport system substrate-binding protein